MFVNKIVEELLFSVFERTKLIDGKNDIDISDEVIEGENYIEFIKNIFVNKNIYLKNKETYHTQNIEITDYLVKKLETKDPIPRTGSVEKISIQENSSNPDTTIIQGTEFNKNGKKIDDPNLKPGNCIFTFRNKANGELFTSCINHPDPKNGMICATETEIKILS